MASCVGLVLFLAALKFLSYCLIIVWFCLLCLATVIDWYRLVAVVCRYCKYCVMSLKAVEEEGGFETVSSERKWPKIAERLGYGLSSKGISAVLQQHYKKILHPFDLFNQSKSAQSKSVRSVIVS